MTSKTMDPAPEPPQDLTCIKNSSGSSFLFFEQPRNIPSLTMETESLLSLSRAQLQTADLSPISTGSPLIVEKPQDLSMPSTPTMANISGLSPTAAQFHTAGLAANSAGVSSSIAEQAQGISLTSLAINSISSPTVAQYQTAGMAAISTASSPAIVEKDISISAMTNNSDSSPTTAQHGASELAAFSDIALTFDSFPSFRKLLIELRLKIWNELVPKSQRVVNLIYDDGQDRYFSFNSKPPVILHVSQESRSVGLKVYSICFGTYSYPAHIPFDFERDILYFDDYLANSLVLKTLRRGNVRYNRYNLTGVGPYLGDDYSRVQKVAVNESILATTPKNLTSGPGGVLFPFLGFKNIKSLFVVVEVVNPYFRGEIFLCELQSDEISIKYLGSLQVLNASGVGTVEVVRALREGEIHIADSSQSADSIALELRSEVEKHGMPVSCKISGQMEPYFLVHQDGLAEEDEEELSTGAEMSENDCLISVEEVQGLADEAEDHRQMLQSKLGIRN